MTAPPAAGPLLVAVTGGIGSGKSTLARRLAARGATVVDADVLARVVVAPGSEGLAEVVAAFGTDVLAADGTLDRAALGARVFADPAARRRLEAITHPRVRELSTARLAAVPAGEVAVYDVPLLAEGRHGRAGFDVVVVVRADPQVRVERLVGRGLAADDAERRIAAQASDADREALADVVIDNSGDEAALEAGAEALWTQLTARIAGARPAGGETGSTPGSTARTPIG